MELAAGAADRPEHGQIVTVGPRTGPERMDRHRQEDGVADGADPDQGDGRLGRSGGAGQEEREPELLADFEVGGPRSGLVDEDLVGSVGIGEPTSTQYGEVDREPRLSGSDQPSCQGRVDPDGYASKPGIHTLRGDLRNGAQRRLGLLQREAVRDGGVRGVGRGEDPVVCGRGRPGRGETCQAQSEAEPEQDPGRDQTTPPQDQPPTRDERDGCHRTGQASTRML